MTHLKQGDKPKYETTHEANEAFYKILNELHINFKNYDFGYEREWDDGKYVGDFLTVYKSDRYYKTTMSPEKFEAMDKVAQKDFITYIAMNL